MISPYPGGIVDGVDPADFSTGAMVCDPVRAPQLKRLVFAEPVVSEIMEPWSYAKREHPGEAPLGGALGRGHF